MSGAGRQDLSCRTAEPQGRVRPTRLTETQELFLSYAGLLLSLALTAHVLPAVAQEYAYSIILAGMVYLPVLRADARLIPLSAYGLSTRRFLRDTAWTLPILLVVFPLFALGNHLVQSELFLRRFAFAWPQGSLAYLILEQVGFIALPEEIFYRGWMQSVLARRWPARLRLFGADFGLAVWLTSLLFAIGHLASIPAPFRLAVFFPSLLFGWLRNRFDSLWPAILTHGLANVLQAVLIASYTP